MDKRFKLLTPADKASEGKELVITGKGQQGETTKSYFKKAPAGQEDVQEVKPCSFAPLYRDATSGERIVVTLALTCSWATGFLGPSSPSSGTNLFITRHAPVDVWNGKAWTIFWFFIGIGLNGWFLNTMTYLGLTHVSNQISKWFRLEFFKQLMIDPSVV